MKRLFAIVTVMALVVGTPLSLEAKKIKMKMAGMAPEGHMETLTQRKFIEVLEELSGGSMTTTLYGNNQLGTPDTFIDTARRGTIEMFAAGTEVAGYHPQIALLEVPYIYKGYGHARRALEGKPGEMVSEGIVEETGLRLLNYFPHGFRVFATKTEVKKFEDYKNMRIRMPNIPLYMNFAKEVGMNPQALAFAELYTALEQGVVQGSGNAYDTMQNLGLDAITPYVQDTQHILIIHSIFINEKFYQKLSDEQKGWINEAAAQSAAYAWDLVEDVDDEAIAYLEKNEKVKILYPDDEFMEKMRAAAARTYPYFYNNIPRAKEIMDAFAEFE